MEVGTGFWVRYYVSFLRIIYTIKKWKGKDQRMISKSIRLTRKRDF